MNGTRASSRTLAKRNASISFLTGIAPSVWLEFGFRRQRTQASPLRQLPQRTGESNTRLASASGLAQRHLYLPVDPGRGTLVNICAKLYKKHMGRTAVLRRTPPFLEARGRYRRNEEF